jgi:ankyrin repeat protein
MDQTKDQNQYLLDLIRFAILENDIDKILQLTNGDLDMNLDNSCMKTLHIAAFHDCVDIISKLVINGADVNCTDSANGLTPLYYAAINKNKRSIKLLLDLGSDVNFTNYDHLTPLHYAVKYDKLEAVSILLEYHADPNIADNFKDTPVARAIRHNKLDLLKLLHQHGARLDHVDIRSLYTLIENQGREPMVLYLLENLDPDSIRKEIRFDGLCILKTCISYDKIKAVEYIVERYLPRDPVVFVYYIERITARNMISVVKRMLELVKIPAEYLKHSARIAFYNIYDDLFKYFVNVGIDVNYCCNSDGQQTYLHLSRNIDEVVLLLKNGANPFKKNGFGSTPIRIYRSNDRHWNMTKVISKYMTMLKLYQASKGIFKFEPSLQREIATSYLLGSG